MKYIDVLHNDIERYGRFVLFTLHEISLVLIKETKIICLSLMNVGNKKNYKKLLKKIKLNEVVNGASAPPRPKRVMGRRIAWWDGKEKLQHMHPGCQASFSTS